MTDQSYMMGVFPSKGSFAIFCSYISLFVSSGLLVTAVSKQNIYGFNKTIAILLTEFLKLLICLLIHLWRSRCSIKSMCQDLQRNKQLLVLYLIPAFLYCMYNNLTFINLNLFDLPTYYCLMQFRIVLTAIIYQILFRRDLNKTQWLSLFVLTVGCFIKELNVYEHTSPKIKLIRPTRSPHNNNNDQDHRELDEAYSGLFNQFVWPLSLLLLQMFCSCFAGVYNEYLLKDSATAKGADVILQNIFMYFDSFVCNVLVYYFGPDDGQATSGGHAMHLATTMNAIISNPLVIILILNNTMSGLVTSMFLKSLNSIMKTYAAALEILAITLLAWLLFNVVIDFYTMIAIVLITLSIAIYSKSPVSVAPPNNDKPHIDHREFKPLATSDDDELDI